MSEHSKKSAPPKGQAAAPSVLSPMASSSAVVKRDLVTARMTVSAPARGKLTGNLDSVQSAGKNTAWRKGPKGSTIDRSVTGYHERVEYLKQNQSGHPFAKQLLARHEAPAEEPDRRGISCAEGASVFESHKRLASAGREFGAHALQELRESIAGKPDIPAPPTFGKNAKRAHVNKMMNAYEQRVQTIRDEHNRQADAQVAAVLGMPGHEYVAKEASFMAWNDIQRHGRLSHVQHDPHSDISPGNAMDYCVQCRAEIASKLTHQH